MSTRRRVRSKRRAPASARWREACVDGVLHVAFAAAERAETAAERCMPRAWRPRSGVRRRHRRRVR